MKNVVYGLNYAKSFDIYKNYALSHRIHFSINNEITHHDSKQKHVLNLPIDSITSIEYHGLYIRGSKKYQKTTNSHLNKYLLVNNKGKPNYLYLDFALYLGEINVEN